MDYTGQRFDQYQIIEKLGQGGMATVYKAFDTRLDRDVAIKVVRKESIPPEQLERILKRFEREAKALAKFLHPSIVPVHDYGEYQGAPYLVMAYLPGGTLKDRIGEPVPVETVLNWIRPIASALSFAHQRGVIHRDVKPSNILTTEDGSLMLSDFGIAQILEESTTQLTATGMGVGTPEYMAPEQWQGQASAASDQYALGVVMYELLTGQKPFTADTPLAVALKVMSEPLPRPSKYVEGIPEAVEKVLYKLLAREPGDRYADMANFLRGIKTFEPGSPNIHPNRPEVTEVPATPDEPEEIFVDEGETIDQILEFEQKPIDKKGVTLSASDVGALAKKDKSISPTEAKNNNERKPQREIASKGVVKGLGDRQNSAESMRSSSEKHKPTGRNTGWIFGLSGISVLIIGIIFLAMISLCLGLIVPLIQQPATSKPVGSGKTSTAVMETTEPTEGDSSATLDAQVTQTAKVQSTATAKAVSEATAQAQKTSTADAAHKATEQAQITATAQSAYDTFNNFIDNAILIHEEKAHSLEHKDDDFVKTYYTGVELKNFAIDVTFVNPYALSVGGWDYGLLFRGPGGNDQYRMYLTSDKDWRIENWDEEIVSAKSDYMDLLTGTGEKNRLQFLALEDIGYLFVNNQFITELDLSERKKAGDIIIGIGFLNGHEIEGYATAIENLRIYQDPSSIVVASTEIVIEEEEGMHYFRVIDDEQGYNYRMGPVSSSRIKDYKITFSPNDQCFAFIAGSTVYYGILGDISINRAGDFSEFELIQQGASGENEFIKLYWKWDGSSIFVDDVSRLAVDKKILYINAQNLCGR
jgi:eukaryotic-like serine/threonine-protein kinase